MPRRPNTRPTSIYWLFDTRTGVPFYCGKTVESPKVRLNHHFKDARRWPSRHTATRLIECGKENVRIDVVEVVAPDGDWSERERHWISVIRASFSTATNISKGGQGPAGYIPTDAQRERSRVTMLGNKNAKGTTYTAEQRQAISERLRGRKATSETRAKMKASHRGSPSQEERDRIAASLRGKPHSEERKAAMRAGWARRKAKSSLTYSESVVC